MCMRFGGRRCLATKKPTRITAQTTCNNSMNYTNVSGDVSPSELNEAGCGHTCGVCPPCVFSPKPPVSARRLWKVSDEFERRFVVALLSRCGSVRQLEDIQRSLSGTSWPWFTYARSRSSPRDSSRCSHGKPTGLDMDKIWRWFGSSPDWIKTSYICRVFSLCDFELLRMLSNLTSVLLVRQKRDYLHFNVSNHIRSQQDKDSEHPALMVVPGSSKSVSGVSQYRDFVSCLPVFLSKRILGLLEEQTLKRCKKVCRYWQHLTEETMEEMKFRRSFQDQHEVIMKAFCGGDILSPTYANMVDVPVPVSQDENDVHPGVQKIQPFEAAYAKIQTKPVQMEERNVYCGAYFTKELLKEEYQHRVLDYRGGFLMATSSKDRSVRLLRVASETKMMAAIKGHDVIRAVQLREDRDLLITAGCETCIRCWDLKTDRCEKVLYGHTGTVNCLDVQADKLVSGAKDFTVKVWSLRTGCLFKDLNFRHHASVLCVKIHKSVVYSSCARGLVKVWNMETASLLRVIKAHKSSVKCLFINDWHFLSGDSDGKVTAWSVSCEAKKCLMTFNHPAEVKSLTLLFLRVITGCSDGKIRMFNFLTGDCLRDIRIESESGSLLSLHFQDHSILVNTTAGVQLYQFAKVFWDYTDPPQGSGGDGVTREGSVSERSVDLCKKCSYSYIGKNVTTSPTQKIVNPNRLKPKRTELVYQTKSPTKEKCESAKQSVIQSENAACERMKKRGPHHPPTRDAILLRLGATQRALLMDEVGLNMERNAGLRDSWGPRDLSANRQNLRVHLRPPQSRPKTCPPILKRAVSRPLMNCPRSREVSTAPASTKRHSLCKTDQAHVLRQFPVIQLEQISEEKPSTKDEMILRGRPNIHQ